MVTFNIFNRDDEGDECGSVLQQQTKQSAVDEQNLAASSNPFLDIPNATTAVEYKKGYVMRKCCVDSNGKKSKLSSATHGLCDCEVQCYLSFQHLGHHFIEPGDYQDAPLSKILHFV
jgi:PH/SEC7 domain-containing protein